jgi:hypothetical protein
LLVGAAAITSIVFGLYWDISWHMTIGRDTFWTPAHLAIQAIESGANLFSKSQGIPALARLSKMCRLRLRFHGA